MNVPSKKVEDLNPIELRTVIDWVFYHLPMDLRRKFMYEHPAIYNKLHGKDLMQIQFNDDFRQEHANTIGVH